MACCPWASALQYLAICTLIALPYTRGFELPHIWVRDRQINGQLPWNHRYQEIYSSDYTLRKQKCFSDQNRQQVLSWTILRLHRVPKYKANWYQERCFHCPKEVSRSSYAENAEHCYSIKYFIRRLKNLYTLQAAYRYFTETAWSLHILTCYGAIDKLLLKYSHHCCEKQW